MNHMDKKCRKKKKSSHVNLYLLALLLIAIIVFSSYVVITHLNLNSGSAVNAQVTSYTYTAQVGGNVLFLVTVSNSGGAGSVTLY